MNNLSLTAAGQTMPIGPSVPGGQSGWGLVEPRMEKKSRAPSKFWLTVPAGDPATPTSGPASTAWAQIPFEGQVTITDTDNNVVIFKGRRVDLNGDIGRGQRSVTLEFQDPWYDLDHIVYQMRWTQYSTSGNPPVVTYTTQYSPRVFLFMDADQGPITPWGYWTTAAQIGDILSYVAAGNPTTQIQAGKIDPLMILPVLPMQSPMCADAIIAAIRSDPGICTWFNYAAAGKPTLNMRTRANLMVPNGTVENGGQITLPVGNGNVIGSDGAIHVSTKIRPRPDLQCPQVVIAYQTTSTVDGQSSNDFFVDAYPPNPIPNVGDQYAASALRTYVACVDLRGSSVTHVKASIRSVAFDPQLISFWQNVKPELNNPEITGLAIVNTAINSTDPVAGMDCITIKDYLGNPVDSLLTLNRIISGSVASWMTAGNVPSGAKITSKKVTVQATVSYQQAGTGAVSVAGTLHNVPKHVVTFECELTNSAPGLVAYETVSSLTGAEVPAPYLAYGIWCAVNNVALNVVDPATGRFAPPANPPLPFWDNTPFSPTADQIGAMLAAVPPINTPANLQWEGTHEIIFPGTIPANAYYHCGNVLNLSDGTASGGPWSEMNAQIYGVTTDFKRNTVTIEFGPNRHKSPSEFFDLMKIWQQRIAWDNPNVRATGDDPSVAGGTIPSDTVKANTNGQALPQLAYHSLVSNPQSPFYKATHFADATGVLGPAQIPLGAGPGLFWQTLDPVTGAVTLNSNTLLMFLNQIFEQGVTVRFFAVNYPNAQCQPVHRWLLGTDELPGNAPTQPPTPPGG